MPNDAGHALQGRCLVSEARKGIVCAGNWIVDIIHDLPVWPDKSDLVEIANQTVGIGGGAANVAFDLSAFQVAYPVVPMGLLGQDSYCDTVLQACSKAGLPVDHLRSVSGAKTAHTHVMNVPGDSRTFFYCAGVNDSLDVDSLQIADLAPLKPRLLYLGYLNLLPKLDAVGADGRTGAARLLATARAAGMITCVDLVSTQSDSYAQTVLGTLPEIDWLFLNEVEATRATGIVIDGENDRAGLSRAGDQLLQNGLRQGCILHTPQVSLWKTATQEIWCDVLQIPKADIKSPVGAGDAFAAGVLHGLHEGWPAQDSIQLGHKAASACLRIATASDGLPSLADL